ncbi:ADP-dependent glucokinase-like [Glandiceps talaboti]
MATALHVGSMVTLVIVLVAYYYKKNVDAEFKQNLNKVTNSLLKAEQKYQVAPKTRVAVGLGGCFDVRVDSLDLLDKLGFNAPDDPKHYDMIESMTQLLKVFAYFFKHGAAGERYMSDKDSFQKVMDVAKVLPDTQQALGGNAALMANRLAIEGCDVLLGASMTNDLKEELREEVQVAGNILSKDDIHFSLEFKSGETWGKYTTPRSNRFIIHSDEANPRLDALEAFQEKLPGFQAHMLVIGGLQMMDSFPSKKKIDRIKALGDMLKSVPEKTRIHFELASFAEEKMMNYLMDNVLPYSDSLGMNEQELANLHSLMNYGNVTLVSDAYPRVATVLDQMRMIYNLLHKTPKVNGKRPLTRIHTHTLAFQAILTEKNSAWKNTMAAAAKASLTAFRYVCQSKEIDTARVRLIMDDSFSISRQAGSNRMYFKPDRPVSCWDEGSYEICVSPVLVCTEIIQTAGGGDNVSSAGLVLQI